MNLKYAFIFILSLFAVGSTARMSDVEYKKEFSKFVDTYDKTYDYDEYNIRYNIFKDNLDKINTHNDQFYCNQHSWKMKVNEFTDMQSHEFKQKFTGTVNKLQSSVTFTSSFPKTNTLPLSFDWSTKGAVTPVKNQQQCGSCWAFSTTGSTEGAWFIKYGNLVSLSEQQLVDCSKAEGNDGCSGGLMDNGFKYIENNGLCTESDYGYTAQDGTCQTACKPAVHITSFVDVEQNNESILQAAVYHTPISVAVEADQWQFYSSGVLTTACGTNLDHGVLLVGWGIQNNVSFWKVKNSWGPDWGDEGYILLQRNVASPSGQCGIAMQPSYPIV